MRHSSARRLPTALSLVATLAACAGGLDDREVFEQLFAGSADAGVIPTETGGITTGSEDASTDTGGGMTPGGDYSDVPRTVFQTACGVGCHDAATASGGLDLLSPGYTARLADAFSTSAECGGEALVNTGEPTESLVYRKLLDPPPCGARMPFGRQPLDSGDIDRVRGWIAAGMPEDDSGDSPGAEPNENLDRSGWTVDAFPLFQEDDNRPQNAVDGDLETRYTTTRPMAGDEWFQVDFGVSQTFAEVEVDSRASPGDHSRSYEVFATDDPAERGDPIASGAGDPSGITTITFEVQTARYLVIAQTGSDPVSWWSIHELNVR